MTEPAYDLLIRGGCVATVSDVFEADVAISGETIAAIGPGIDAREHCPLRRTGHGGGRNVFGYVLIEER